ncbi:MAG: Ig-like domain-containing protein, partial [Owenweeksia sp.]
MRAIITFLLCFPWGVWAQLSVNDNFTDGDFTNNPAWSGNPSDFEVLAGEMHLNNLSPASNDTSYLVTPSTILVNGNWQFYYRFTQNPSSSNYGRVYLVSDQSDLKGALNGYYVDFGQSSDKIRLMRQSGSTASMILESATGLLNTSTVEARVQVTRDVNGLWTLMADTGSVVDPLVNIGTPAIDVTHTGSSFMGVFCRYTVTRASAFYFDDFNCTGQPNLDVTPPELDTLIVQSPTSLSLQFNEPLDPATAQQVSNYTVDNSIGQPSSANLGSGNTVVTLDFITPFSNGNSYTLSITSLEDTAGNQASFTENFMVNDPPATILSAQALNTSTVRLTFSEAVTGAFASNTSNFMVNNGAGSPSSTAQPRPDQVELQFSPPLQTGVTYRVLAQNIQDSYGNLSTDSAFFRLGTVNIFDDFSDGDFTANPTWGGKINDFEVDLNNQLHLNAAAAGTSYLSTPSTISENAQWQFYVKMDFATSASNLARVYIMSLGSSLNDSTTRGYFVLIGGTNDEISLFRQDGNSKTALIQSSVKLIDTDPVEVVIRVERDSQGRFTLAADTSLNGSFFNIGTGSDAIFTSSTHFGVYCSYTSTRTDLFYFDDFALSGDPFTDDQSPALTAVNVLNNTTLELTFNEGLMTSSAEDETSYFVSGGIGQPDQAQLDAQETRKVVLVFNNPFQNKMTYNIDIQGLSDDSGNALDTNVSFTFFIAQEGSVVINEIMADPSPVVGVPPNALPEREYLEL